ncbi:MAG: GAF domain-containing sensor histidine kinase [Gemmatimonadaceae bacterium]
MRKPRVLTHDRFRGPPSSQTEGTSGAQSSLRELLLIREIVHAFLHADRPSDVFQFTLDRVSPMVGATFASVYLVDGVSELMHLVAAYNWPERYRPWLGEMRVRLGYGPSGEAAAERRAIEVHDVFADKNLEDWQEVASELQFRSLVALPLQTAKGVTGAVTFYYGGTGAPSPETRGLLRIVADQMAATAEKASLIDELRRANVALREANEELEGQVREVLDARRIQDEFLASISGELRTPLTTIIDYLGTLQRELAEPLTDRQRADLSNIREGSAGLLSLVDDLLDLTSANRGGSGRRGEEFDPRDVVRDAAANAPSPSAGVQFEVRCPEGLLAQMKSDRARVTKILTSLLSQAFRTTSNGQVVVGVEVKGDHAVFRVQDTGSGIAADATPYPGTDGRASPAGPGLALALSRRLAHLLGGDIFIDAVPGAGATYTVELPLELDRDGAVASDPADYRKPIHP